MDNKENFMLPDDENESTNIPEKGKSIPRGKFPGDFQKMIPPDALKRISDEIKKELGDDFDIDFEIQNYYPQQHPTPSQMKNQVEDDVDAGGECNNSIGDEDNIPDLPDSILNELLGYASMIFSGIPQEKKKSNPAELDRTNTDEKPVPVRTTSYTIERLMAYPFGSIKCKKSSHLYNELINAYGDDTSKYLDEKIGLRKIPFSSLIKKLPWDNIESLKLEEETSSFLVFSVIYKENKDKSLPFYVSIFKDDDDDFVIFVPEFANSFFVEKTFDGVETPYLFKEDDGMIHPEHSVLQDFGIQFALAPIQRSILKVKEFGTIKNIRGSITNESSGEWLQIGTIESNESTDAILIKKDADFDVNQKVFPLYAKFNEPIPLDILRNISEILFKQDLNNTPAIADADLKFNQHDFYIEIDLGRE